MGGRVTDRGKLTIGNFDALRKPKIGKALVLTGTKGGYRVLSPDSPMSYYEALASGYSDYIEFSLSAETKTTNESVTTADPGFSFSLNIQITARLEEPATFIQEFGPDTSIFEPFYQTWLGDIRDELGRFSPDDVGSAQETLSRLQLRVENNEPVISGVRILGFHVKVSIDPRYARQALAAQAAMLHQNYGPSAVAALKAAHPESSAMLETYLSDLRSIRDDEATFEDQDWERARVRVKQLVDDGVIDRAEQREFLRMEQLKLLQRGTGRLNPIPIAGPGDGAGASPGSLLPRPGGSGAPATPRALPRRDD